MDAQAQLEHVSKTSQKAIKDKVVPVPNVVKKNSVVFSPLANYTEQAIAAGQRS
jgi:hypothetical protein